MMSRTTRHSRFASSGRIDRFAIYGFFRLMQTPGEQLPPRFPPYAVRSPPPRVVVHQLLRHPTFFRLLFCLPQSDRNEPLWIRLHLSPTVVGRSPLALRIPRRVPVHPCVRRVFLIFAVFLECLSASSTFYPIPHNACRLHQSTLAILLCILIQRRSLVLQPPMWFLLFLRFL